MNWIVTNSLLAQSIKRITDDTIVWTFPTDPLDAVLLGALVVLAISSIFVYVRDTKGLAHFWRIWLPLTRVAVIIGLILILLNPHTRTSEESISPSRVVVLVDVSTSMSMENRVVDPRDSAAEKTGAQSRSEVARQLLETTELIEKLRETHEVHVFTFGEKLHERVATFPRLEDELAALAAAEANDSEANSDGSVDDEDTDNSQGEQDDPTADDAKSDGGKPKSKVDWETVLEPRGGETRLGDALRDLVVEYGSDTFSGIVVVSDGVNNVGNDPDLAKRLALKQNVRFVTVGVGSTRQLPNLNLAGIVVPTFIRVNDPYELKAYVRGENLAERGATVELLGRPAGDPDAAFTRVEVDEGSENPVLVDLPDDGGESEIVFRKTNTVAGKLEYVVRVSPERDTIESLDEDNQKSQVVEITEKPTKVLMIAGGPMRDYRFIRNMLTRHAGVDLSVWLQTVDTASVGLVSQESNNPLLTAFPSKQELFEQDVVIAFDPDWSALTEEDRQNLAQWNGSEGGGLILVAGDVYTPELVSADQSFDVIRDLYPVLLEALLLNVNLDDEDAQPWAPDFTRDAKNVEFLQIADDPVSSEEAWDEFEGFYRCYPTVGTKGGTIVYAHFANPRASSAAGPHVLLAGHSPGLGKVLYLGSSEIWRLRGVGEKQFDNFWTKMVREASKGHLQSGGDRAPYAPEKPSYELGDDIVIRARLLDADYEPLLLDSVEMKVADPNGRELVPSPRLLPVPKSPGLYRGSFRATLASQNPGYRVSLDGIDGEPISVSVTIPNRETEETQQNARLLQELGKEPDRGAERNFYVSLEGRSGEQGVVERAAETIPTFLANRTKPIVIDERRNEVWDRSWVLYLFVAVLSMEWLTRKLLKLA